MANQLPENRQSDLFQFGCRYVWMKCLILFFKVREIFSVRCLIVRVVLFLYNTCLFLKHVSDIGIIMLMYVRVVLINAEVH